MIAIKKRYYEFGTRLEKNTHLLSRSSSVDEFLEEYWPNMVTLMRELDWSTQDAKDMLWFAVFHQNPKGYLMKVYTKLKKEREDQCFQHSPE
jgi:hypothetical protein